MSSVRPVIVVSGLPRSGTSMMMRMLRAAGVSLVVDEVRKADEDNPRGYFEYERVKQLPTMEDKTWVSDARGCAIKVISQLLPALPPENRYSVVFMLRDIDEVLASQAKMLAKHGSGQGNCHDAQLGRVFEKHLQQVRGWIGAQANFDALYVHYAQMVTMPIEQCRRVLDFLRIEASVEAMARIAELGLYRNRANDEAGGLQKAGS